MTAIAAKRTSAMLLAVAFTFALFNSRETPMPTLQETKQFILKMYNPDDVMFMIEPHALNIGMHSAFLLGFLLTEVKRAERGQEPLFNIPKEVIGYKDGWLFMDFNHLQKAVRMTTYTRRKAIKELETRGLIEVQTKGRPPRVYIKIHNACLNFYDKCRDTQIEKYNKAKKHVMKAKTRSEATACISRFH